MRILLIIPELNKGGAERLVVDMCNELRIRPGIEVCIVVFRPNNAYALFSKQLDIRVVPSKVIPSMTKRMVIEVSELQQLIDTFQPDVIHSHLFETEIVLSQVNCGKALRVMHFHDNMPQLEPFRFRTLLSKKALTNRYERNIVLAHWQRSVQRIALSISRDTTSYAQRVLPKGECVHQLLNGILVERFKRREPYSEATLNLCMIGSLVPKKGQELAIRAVAALHEMGHPFHLYLLGDGPMRTELEGLTNDLTLGNFVHFEGNVDHPETFLHQSFAYLHTASYEPLGLVLLEAMAAGVPIICTNGRGNRDLITHGKNGIWIDQRDPQLIAKALLDLLADPIRVELMRQSALDFVKKFDMPGYVDRLLEIYRL